MIAAFFALAAEQPLFWPRFITAFAAVFAVLAVIAFSIVVHQLVTQGIGPIRWFRPFRFVRVRILLRREYRQQAAIVTQNERRRHLNAVAGGRR